MGEETNSSLDEDHYQRFRDVFYREHRHLIDNLSPYEKLVNRIFALQGKTKDEKVARLLAKAVANSFGAVLILCENGYGVDAMKVARSMFEGTVNLLYLAKHPEEFVNFYDFSYMQTERYFTYMLRFAPHLLERISENAKNHQHSNYLRVKERFTRPNGTEMNSWSKQSFAALCKEVQLYELYLTLYGMASSLHHMGMQSLRMHPDPTPDILDIEIAPSKIFVPQALDGARVSALLTLEAYMKLAKIGTEEDLAILKKALSKE